MPAPDAAPSAIPPPRSAAQPTQILIVKTSSLGDVVHTLPALSDARAAYPQLRADWLVEHTFQRIPAWHPAVRRVLPCELRRWLRSPLRSWRSGEWGRFRAALRAEDYDLVLDAQGLVKSALLAAQARGVLVGPSARCAREPLAACWYARRLTVPRFDAAHAVERMRRLFAQALGYPLPDTPPDSGLDRERFPRPPDAPEAYVLLLHGTTWPSKRWAPERWRALAQWIAARGLRVVLPWGNAAEHAAAQAVADACGGLVLPRLELDALAGWIAHARAAVGVDTGLAHLAAALGVPQISLYGPTLPQLTGAVGENQVWLRSDDAGSIDRSRPTTVALERVCGALAPWLG